jgi:hypothetical protein
VAIRSGFRWQVTDEDPKEAAKKTISPQELASVLPSEGADTEQWFKLAFDAYGVTKTAFEKIRPKCKNGLVNFARKTADGRY